MAKPFCSALLLSVGVAVWNRRLIKHPWVVGWLFLSVWALFH